MFAAAFKTNVSDGLIAYAAREKGNYFAGTRGADGYRNNPVYEDKDSGHTNTTERMIPNMARFYRPGGEVVNSNVSSKSLLLKNNWYLPANQKIALAYMKTRVEFGEHNPFYSNIAQGYSDDFYSIDRGSISEQMMPGQGMDSTIQTKSYKLGYAWQPDSPWIDLQANVWRVNTRSTRYQNGAADLYVDSPYELITDKQEVEDKLKLDNYWDHGGRTDEDAWLLEYNRRHQIFKDKYGYNANDIIWRTPQGNNTDDAPDSGRVAFYRLKQTYSPYRNDRFEGQVFRDGMFDETVQNPAGIKGAYYKYLIKQHADTWMEEGYEYQKREYPIKPYNGELIRKELDPNSPENWPTPEHVRAHAWSPMLSVSYDLTDNGRLHLRWAQAARFPSIYEATTVNSSWTDAYDQAFDLKPERSTNWEIGYTYNFAPPASKNCAAATSVSPTTTAPSKTPSSFRKSATCNNTTAASHAAWNCKAASTAANGSPPSARTASNKSCATKPPPSTTTPTSTACQNASKAASAQPASTRAASPSIPSTSTSAPAASTKNSNWAYAASTTAKPKTNSRTHWRNSATPASSNPPAAPTTGVRPPYSTPTAATARANTPNSISASPTSPTATTSTPCPTSP